MLQEINPIFTGIKSMPETIDNIHQSCFRSTTILNHIVTMVERGDSKETILDVYYYLSR